MRSARWFRPRYGPLGVVSDVLLVGAAAQKLAGRARARRRPGTGPADLIEVGELILAVGAALRLAQRLRGRRAR